MDKRHKKGMRNFEWFIFYGFISDNLIWIRICPFKYGIELNKQPKLFSERMKFKRYLLLPMGWRLRILKAKGY
jgi:hypothetical protein